MRESHCRPSPRSPASLQRRTDSQRRWRIHTRKCSCILIALAGRSPAMRDRSEEAATPGCPQRFHVWEPLGSVSFRLSVRLALQLAPTSALWKTAADPAFAITGSVSFTPAVIELSLMCSRWAIRIRGLAVRKLWSVEIPCGRGRKTRQKFEDTED